ncbi:Uncharacterized protein Rs2_29049 [Raphanus sativus]|nr:Uncharacterized protein Rs2_29049 [Raphanus sativus]
MAFSPNEKKDSDVEMSEANQASPAQDAPALTQTFVEGFSSFQDKMERRRAEMESSVAGPSATSVVPTLGSDVTLTPDPAALVLGPDVTPVPISTLPASGPDVSLPAGEIVVPEQASDVQARLEGSPFAPIVVSEDAVEVMPPPPEKKREIVLGLPASNAVPPSRDVQKLGLPDQRRGKGVLGVRKAKFRRDYRSIAPRYFVKSFFPLLFLDSHILSCDQFVSLIDGMLGDCGLEVTRLSKELDSSRETLKRTEAVLQSIESTHAAQTSTLEARISDLERDLGKTVSSLLKAKEEKKSKSSEVRRLKRRIQRFEEMGTCTAAELAGPSSSGTLVLSSEIPEVQDAGIVADKGGEEVGEGDGEAVPALGESEDEGGVPEDS